MRVLIVTNLFPPAILGGYEILCSQVAQALADRRHEVTVLTSDFGAGGVAQGGRLRVLRDLRLTYDFPGPASHERILRRRVGRLNGRITADTIQATQPDVVFLWSQLRLTVGPSRAAEGCGRPILYSFNDEHPIGFSPAPFGWRPRQLVSWAADRWIFPEITNRDLSLGPATCISRTLRDRLAQGGVPVGECKVVSQGIPIADFPLKARPGALAEPPRVMYAGQLHAYKGVHTLIEACHGVVGRDGLPLHLAIYGTGADSYMAELERQAARGPATVAFHGHVPHDVLAAAYRTNDILVFPSVWDEPFGLTHLEAMASGTPVISTPNGGPGEFLVHEQNALLFEAENPTQLASCIRRMVGDEALRRRLARQGRETVWQGFTLQRYVVRLEQMLEQTRRTA